MSSYPKGFFEQHVFEQVGDCNWRWTIKGLEEQEHHWTSGFDTKVETNSLYWKLEVLLV